MPTPQALKMFIVGVGVPGSKRPVRSYAMAVGRSMHIDVRSDTDHVLAVAVEDPICVGAIDSFAERVENVPAAPRLHMSPEIGLAA